MVQNTLAVSAFAQGGPIRRPRQESPGHATIGSGRSGRLLLENINPMACIPSLPRVTSGREPSWGFLPLVLFPLPPRRPSSGLRPTLLPECPTGWVAAGEGGAPDTWSRNPRLTPAGRMPDPTGQGFVLPDRHFSTIHLSTGSEHRLVPKNRAASHRLRNGLAADPPPVGENPGSGPVLDPAIEPLRPGRYGTYLGLIRPNILVSMAGSKGRDHRTRQPRAKLKPLCQGMR